MARLMSAAGTGYFYTIKKPRLRERMTLRKYDPVGEDLHMIFAHDCIVNLSFALFTTVRKHVLFIEQKKK